MAIRDIVTRGFGNGTYSPGVADVPVRGWTTIGDPPNKPGIEVRAPVERAHVQLPKSDRRK